MMNLWKLSSSSSSWSLLLSVSGTAWQCQSKAWSNRDNGQCGPCPNGQLRQVYDVTLDLLNHPISTNKQQSLSSHKKILDLGCYRCHQWWIKSNFFAKTLADNFRIEVDSFIFSHVIDIFIVVTETINLFLVSKTHKRGFNRSFLLVAFCGSTLWHRERQFHFFSCDRHDHSGDRDNHFFLVTDSFENSWTRCQTVFPSGSF